MSDVTLQGVTDFLVATLKSYETAAAQDLRVDTVLETAGIDSFDFVEIVFKIEDHYGIDLDYNANFNFAEMKTIGDLAREIVTRTRQTVAA